MKKLKISIPMILGITLILASLLIFVIIQYRMHIGAQGAQKIVSQMNALLPERTQGSLQMHQDSLMPVLEIDGKDYVAMLEIPAYDLVLPVADQWDTQALSDAPARFSGSAYNRTLVIGGTDYPQQFSFCDEIANGTEIIITDMTGAQFRYTVSRVSRASHAESTWLMDSSYALTLFCHSVASSEYIAVRCSCP